MIKMQLIVVQGRPEGKTIPLAVPVFVIGREEGCHLRPSSDEISRRHSEIRISANGATLQDLGSRNGTFLNGRRLTEITALKSGDLIKVGPLTFAVSIQGAPGASAPAKPSSAAKPLDEVGQEEVASWLVADDKQPIPERPSGVYKGETISIAAYGKEELSRKAAEEATPATPRQQPAPRIAEIPNVATAPTAVSNPSPTPAIASAPAVSNAPVAASPAPPAPVVEDQPAPAPTPPPAVPKPAAKAAPKPMVRTSAGSPPKSIWDELDSIEQLPEGQGDEVEPEGTSDNTASHDGVGAEVGANQMAATMPEEWMDESNPFYAAKMKAGSNPEMAVPEVSKASFKDSSEAANAILKKMLDRRKGGG